MQVGGGYGRGAEGKEEEGKEEEEVSLFMCVCAGYIASLESNVWRAP